MNYDDIYNDNDSDNNGNNFDDNDNEILIIMIILNEAALTSPVARVTLFLCSRVCLLKQSNLEFVVPV